MNQRGIKVDVVNSEQLFGFGHIKGTVQNDERYKSEGEVILSIYHPIVMVRDDGAIFEMPENGGHAVTITGMTENGRLIVSSWGRKYYVDPEYNDKSTLQVIRYEK